MPPRKSTKASPRKQAASTKATRTKSSTNIKAKTASSKPAVSKTTTPKKVVSPKSVEAEAKAFQAEEPVDKGVTAKDTWFRKRDLINAVVARSGVKRRDAKASTDVLLEVLGETIASEWSMNLPGFGKLKVTKSKLLPKGRVLTVRVRQPQQSESDSD